MKYIRLFTIAGLLLLLASFQQAAKSPGDVALKFLNSLSKLNYKEAKKYGTVETNKLLDMMSSFSTMIPDSIKESKKHIKIEILSSNIQDTKCTVTYQASYHNGIQSLNLIKQQDRWLVFLSKETEEENTEDTSKGLLLKR